MTNILLDCKTYFYNFEIREEQCRFATGVDGRVITTIYKSKLIIPNEINYK